MLTMKRMLSLVVLVLGLVVAGVSYTYDDVDGLCFVHSDNDMQVLLRSPSTDLTNYEVRETDTDNDRRWFPVAGATCRATTVLISGGQVITSSRGESTYTDWPLTGATVAGLLIAALGLAGYSRSRPGGGSSNGVRARSPVDPPSRQQMLASVEERLDVLAAVDAALEWRTDVVRVMEGAADPDAARSAVMALLQVSDVGANAVLAMQLRRFTVSERAAIRAEVDQLQDELRQLSG
jgi:hypothetical protein